MNSQQYPSRDKEYPLKNMFCAPKGGVLCATDFSFIELCSFAQACYDRFGYSVMREVINAGLDPHRWFAGVMIKVITPDLSKAHDPDWVEATKKLLKEKVPDEVRQKAKAANFGFPGGLGAKRFYTNTRSQGTKLTPQESEEMRDAWINTFTEMQYHMQPERAPQQKKIAAYYGALGHDIEADEEEEEDNGKVKYICRMPCGQVRNNCTFNAACNTQFQALTALGAKQAGWNLVYGGYAERLYNFVHDEYLYWLYPNEVKEHVPKVEQLMLAGMRKYIPDVKVGVESTVMLHWDKKAATYDELEWTADGLPILKEPPFIEKLHKEEST